MDKATTSPAILPALASVSYFSDLKPEVLVSIAAITVSRQYLADEIVFLESESCQGLYIVQSGWLKGLIVSPKGRQQIIRLLGPGEYFNEHGVLLKDGCNLVTVQAIEDSTVWVVDRQALLKLMDQHPVICRTISQTLASRVVHLMRLVGDLSLRTVDARLARLLLDQPINDKKRNRRVTQAEMAAQLGTVTDVVNRSLHKLESKGLILLKGHKIEILDRVRLELKAEMLE